MSDVAPQPEAAVAAERLTKRYGSLTAIEDLTFSVAPGEVVGFLGPNGAGKSTTMRILSGTMAGTSGCASIWGVSVALNPAEAKRHMAYMPENNPLPEDLRVEEYLRLRARLKDVEAGKVDARVNQVMEDCDLVRRASGRLIGQLSKGFRQRVGIADALLAQPKVVILDEPTIGLDVVSQKKVREFLRHHNATRKTTILLTSHYMTDIQELCQRVIIIDKGTIFFDGRLSEVIDRFADFKLVTIECEPGPERSAESLAQYGEVVERAPGTVKLKVKRDRVVPVCKALFDSLPVRDIDIQEVPIEDIIRELFARKSS